MGTFIEQQAIDFANVPIIQRGIKASVHLEDWEDVLFWDTMIQRVSPGRYNYLAYSKAENGQRASGSSQCLKYIGHTSKRFFVCIDSDMNYLLQTANINASHFVAQTYTYSWENHYTEASRLQTAFTSVAPFAVQKFNFKVFLTDYSRIVYHPLLALLYCLRNKDPRITLRDFSACLPHQCKFDEMSNNGRSILTRIEEGLSDILSRSGISSEIDYKAEERRYRQLGLSVENAFLHIRGHNLYDLLKSIGHQLCSCRKIDFENQVLNATLPETTDYWEIEQTANDLHQILL